MSTRNKLSRREFLRMAGVAAVGAALAACTPPAAPVAPAAGEEAKPAPVEKKTLVLAIQAFAHDAMKPVLATWTEKTGHTVELESGPTTGQEMVTKYAPAFQAGSSPVDVFSDADDSGPSFYRAGWIEPLDDVIPAETWADFPEIFQGQIEVWHSYQGRRYRVPHEFAVGYFWYRKDWFDEKGIQPPKSWDEFISIGKEFTTENTYGTIEALIKPGLMYVYLAYITAQAGGEIFKFDEKTAQAFQFVYDMIYTHKILPEKALSIDYTQQNDEYMKDRVAMMRQWPYFWGVSRGNTDWYREGKAEITLPPAGPAGAKSWWGGWGFSVPKFAPNKPEALDLIAWVTNNENAPILARGQSWFVMPRKSIVEALGDEGLVPAMKMYIDNNVPAPRPFHEKVSEAQSVVDDVGSLFLTKQVSLEEALKQGAERIAALG